MSNGKAHTQLRIDAFQSSHHLFALLALYLRTQFTGTGTDVPLMEWLQKYTFPVESSYQDVEAAKFRYDLLVCASSCAGSQIQPANACAHALAAGSVSLTA